MQYADDVFEERWSGSGGFGDPLNRAPETVADDVRLERVTETDAKTVYGVEIENGLLDAAKTKTLRDKLRASRAESATAPRERLSDIGPTTPVLDIVGTLTLIKDAGIGAISRARAAGTCSPRRHDYRSGCLTEERSPSGPRRDVPH